jgi:putative ABC transport system permease protein
MKYFPLAWTALWRKPGEAILICLAVTVAFTLFGLMLGLHSTYRQLIDSSRMDRLDVDPRFPISSGLRLPMAMRDRIARIPGVSGVGAYYQLRGYHQDPHSLGRIVMVDEGMRVAWSQLPLSSAQWDRLFSTPTGVLASRKVAQKWNLKEGEVFPFITPPGLRADGSTVWEFQVLAVVPDEPTRVNGFILGNYTYVDNSRPLQERGYATGFRVALMDAARANQISLDIDRFFANSGTPTITIPERSNAKISSSSGIATASVTLPVAGAGLFMILLLTANGIAQSVRERIPEFAVLQALGFRNVTITALVFTEAAVPCLVGGILGTALAAALTQWPTRYLPTDLATLPKPTLSPVVLAWAVGSAILLALASSAIPVLGLRRVSVTDALAGR